MTTSYTIKAGDNLWNICKKYFKLSSNAEIAKKVDEVAKTNNIKRPDLIFAGKTLELGAMDTVERTSDPAQNDNKQQNAPVTSPVTPEIEKAVTDKIKLNDIKTYDDIEKLRTSSVSIFSSGVNTDEQKQKAYTQYSEKMLLEYYDINHDGKVTQEEFAQIEEKDALKTNEIVQKKTKNEARLLAEKDPALLKAYDTNEDGHISEEEYEKGEKKTRENIISSLESMPELLKIYDTSGDGKISDEEYETNFLGLTPENRELLGYSNEGAKRTANLFAKNLDINGDGVISKEEFAFFNKTADSLDGQEDGVISATSEGKMVVGILGQNADDKEVNRVVNKYLSGAALTDDEKKILEQSTQKIRASLKKTSGIE